MFRFAVALCALVAVSSALRYDRNDLWSAYKTTHGKLYSGQREVLRREIWESNLDYIQRHNVEADRGMHTYWMGENQFTDLTNSEFRAMMNGYQMSNRTSSVQFVSTLTDTPDAVDWRDKGYVTKVKNQERCGSCWAFSTTGSLEGQTFKKTGKLPSLSEQNLVDCSKKEGNKGCKGGLMDKAFEYVIKNNGIDTEDSYPYTGHDGLSCKFKKADVGATETSFVDVKRGSEEALAQAVAEIGPISVAMDAGHESFQHYRTGIYKEPRCSSIKLDHGVLAVGYGADGGSNYWIVKNSWGTMWGDQGYFKLAKDDHNMCGLATQASYPVV
ncbi:cathepsin L1 [Aplysia californica]|uniref:Cathepsin L1 n=1 Tax=Aplysia californica TaxID=6500 RepID=A0ABM1A487_APLCA|nr:cathepsin L1 [Aplysia californica]